MPDGRWRDVLLLERRSTSRRLRLSSRRPPRLPSPPARSLTPMAHRTPVHVCSECGLQSAKWHGQCPGCEAWNTLVEERRQPPARGRGRAAARRALGPRRGPDGGRAPGAAPAQGGRRDRGRADVHGSASSTACSAADSCPARWCCSAARPGSASRRSRTWCSATSQQAGPPHAVRQRRGVRRAGRLRAERLGRPGRPARCPMPAPRPTSTTVLDTLAAEAARRRA